jgi:hypothetical protein
MSVVTGSAPTYIEEAENLAGRADWTLPGGPADGSGGLRTALVTRSGRPSVQALYRWNLAT